MSAAEEVQSLVDHGGSASTPRIDPKITRGHSCIICAQRKVRCDGQRPCSTCQKANIQCISKPAQPKPARITKHKRDTVGKTKRTEALMRQPELIFDRALPAAGAPDTPVSDLDDGSLIIDQGHSRYVENTLWDGLSKELPRSAEKEGPEDDAPSSGLGPATFHPENLVFGDSFTGNLTDHHPSPVRIFWLWQTYLENVNALVKILHVPTVQQLIFGSAADLSALNRSKEALMFSIYVSALNSVPLNDHSECQRIMGDSVTVLVERFTGLAQRALVNAHFLRSSDLTTLQAYVLFLITLRARCDTQTLWMLTGLAVRSAQRLGLHREKALQGLSIFQAELRRRLWWEILLLESHAAKQCGVASHAGPGFSWDTKQPLNVNDGDLHPEMSEPPKEHIGVTDMVFCSTRYEVGEFTIAQSSPNSALKSIEEIDAEVKELQHRLDERILKYCDPAIPIHFMTLLLGRGGPARVKLRIRRRHMHANKGAGLSLEERNKTFNLCLQLIEIPNTLSTNKAIQRYLWQANAAFPMDALMVIFMELAYWKASERLPEETSRRAWTEIEKAYELQPRLLQDKDNAMYGAMASLAIKAWEKTIISGSRHATTPRFLEVLYARKTARSSLVNVNTVPTPASSSYNSADMNRGDQLMFNAHDLGSALTPELSVTDDPGFWQFWQQFSGEMDEFTAA